MRMIVTIPVSVERYGTDSEETIEIEMPEDPKDRRVKCRIFDRENCFINIEDLVRLGVLLGTHKED